MAKRKAISKPIRQAVLKEKPSSANMLYAVLFAITLLIIVAIIISVRSRSDQDQLTAWATKNANELHAFVQICKDSSGTLDVSNENMPTIVFTCTYQNRQSEQYVLANSR